MCSVCQRPGSRAKSRLLRFRGGRFAFLLCWAGLFCLARLAPGQIVDTGQAPAASPADPAGTPDPEATPPPLSTTGDEPAASPAPDEDATPAPTPPPLLPKTPPEEPNPVDATERQLTAAESLYNGIGGVPQGLNPLFTAPGITQAQGYHLGSLAIHPILSAGFNYGTVSGNGGDRGQNGFYGTLSPAFTLSVGEPATGRTINAVYTGSLAFGADSAGREPYQQTLGLNGTLNFTKLNLGFGLDYAQLSGSDRDFGGQNVNRELVDLSVNASYEYSEKTSLTTSLSAPVNLFGEGSSSEGVTSNSFINYSYSPLTTVGVGFGVGTTEVEQGDAQAFEQALAKFTYLLTDKLTFNGTAGCEFLDAGTKEQITPIFDASLAWAVREGTSITASAQRAIENSAAIAGANYTDTNLSVSISQRLGDVMQFTGEFGYENAGYTGVERGVSTNREDNQLIFQGAVAVHIKDRWVASLDVEYSKDFSNTDAFQSLQDSLQLSYVF